MLMASISSLLYYYYSLNSIIVIIVSPLFFFWNWRPLYFIHRYEICYFFLVCCCSMKINVQEWELNVTHQTSNITSHTHTDRTNSVTNKNWPQFEKVVAELLLWTFFSIVFWCVFVYLCVCVCVNYEFPVPKILSSVIIVWCIIAIIIDWPNQCNHSQWFNDDG